MQLKKGDSIEVTIEKLAFGGAGIGKCHIPDDLAEQKPGACAAEGLMTFVPNVIPGDRVRVALTKIKSNRLEGRLETLLEPSPHRIQPRCRHFEVCGGCTWQNLSYSDQLTFKEAQVRETLHHIGGFDENTLQNLMRPILGCASPWDYRNKMEFSFGRSAETPSKVMLGLHLPKMHHTVFDLTECFLPSPLFVEIVIDMRDFAHREGLDVFDDRTQDGLLRHFMIREGKNTGEVMVNLITSINSFPAIQKFTEHFTTGKWAGYIHSLIWTTIQQSPGVPTWIESQTLAGNDLIHEELHLETGSRLRFEISPQSFFQPNTKQAEILYSTVIALAELSGTQVVYDLYCGTGTIGLFCAHAARHVYGIESVKEAVENARANARLNSIINAEFLIGDVGKSLTLPEPPDVVIVDPPRSGLAPEVPSKIVALGASKIIYVSCNPATLARDLKAFTALGYTLGTIQPVDMFPHTTHIETVVSLRQ